MAHHFPSSSPSPRTPSGSFVDPYHRVYRIDPVRREDLDDAVALWKHLGTHNGDEAHARDLIVESERSFRDGKDRFTLLGKKFNGFNGEDIARFTRAAIGSVIYHDHATPEGTQHYYEETSDGFRLETFREDTLELGGMYVDPDHRGRSGREIGVAMTMFRALLARKFEGLIGPRRVYADFLPPLTKGNIPEIGKEDVTVGNAFWLDVVYPALQEKGVLSAISDYCARSCGGVYARTPEHLYYQLMVQLKASELSYIFAAYFPKELRMSSEVHSRVRSVLSSFGKETKGAQVNVGHSYPDLNCVGYNPVDAGQNWAGSTYLGAIGDRTVAVDIMGDTEANDVYRNPSSQCALVLLPVNGTRHDLQQLRAVVTPGVFAERLARVPRDSLRLLAEDSLAANMPLEVTYRVLPSKSPTQM